jgi:hypothetical protein
MKFYLDLICFLVIFPTRTRALNHTPTKTVMKKITLKINSSDANNIFASSYDTKLGLHTLYTLELNGFGVYEVIEIKALPTVKGDKEMLFCVARSTSALGKLCQYLSNERGSKVSLAFDDGK